MKIDLILDRITSWWVMRNYSQSTFDRMFDRTADRTVERTFERRSIERSIMTSLAFKTQICSVAHQRNSNVKNLFGRAMRTAKNHSKMCSVGPCGWLKTIQKCFR